MQRSWLIGIIVLLVEMAVCVAHQAQVSDGRPWAAVAWGLAWLGLGSSLGFLFGVPRVVRQEGAPAEPGATAAGVGISHQVNTNLEQVSDWLTKLLIGVGLVQLREVPTALAVAAQHVASGLDPKSQSFAAALILLFGSTGFLGGYLTTRLYLSRVLRRADVEGLSEPQRELVQGAEEPWPLLPGAELQVTPEAREVAAKIALIPLEEVRGADLAIWAKAHFILHNNQKALQGYRMALELEPAAPLLRLGYARALYYSQQPEEARQNLLKVRAKLNGSKIEPELQGKLYTMLVLLCLQRPPPEGFTAALEFGEEYLRTIGKPGNGAIYVNLAAACGQKMRWLIEQGGTAQERIETRHSALKYIQQALDVDRFWSRRLTELLVKGHPGKAHQDDDLESFEEDNAFREALGLPLKIKTEAQAA